MKEFTYKVTDTLGIHARPAGLLVKTASEFTSSVTISKADRSADAKKLFSVMSLAVKCGDEITVSCSGSDEDAASDAMKKFLAENL